MPFIVYGVYAVILSLLLAEVVLYPGVVVNNLGFELYWIVLLGIIFSVLVRKLAKRQVWAKLGAIGFYLLAPVLTLVSLVLRYIEFLNHPNFIYSLLHIDTRLLSLFSLALAMMVVPLLDFGDIKKNFSKTVLVVTVLLYHLILLALSYPDLYIAVKKEDGLIEYLTFFAFFAAGFIALMNVKFIRKLSLSLSQKNFLIAMSIFMALGLLVIAGEEISWGQRLAGIETPEHLAELNTQQELNLHNNRNVFHFVYNAYLLINLYGLLSWLGYAALKNKLATFWQLILRLCTSRWYITLLFIPNLMYVLLKESRGSALSFQWEELSELYLALGILSIVILNVMFLRNASLKKAKR